MYFCEKIEVIDDTVVFDCLFPYQEDLTNKIDDA
jgi:hypothetical protein